MKQTQIIKCTALDIDILREVSIETYQDTFGPFNSEENMQIYLEGAYNKEKLLKEIANSLSQFFFIKNGDQVAGYLKLNVGGAQTEDVAEDALEVERIYIRSAFHRQGYGQQLIQFTESIALKNNLVAMWLGVWEHNKPALSFYKKMGFSQVGQHSFFMGDDEQIDYIYIKNLNH